MIKVIDAVWFEKIGIVAIDSDGHGWKAYIGLGLGEDEKADEQSIGAHGMPVGKLIANGAFPNLEIEQFLA